MKAKWIWRGAVILVVIVVAALLVVAFSLGAIVKKGVLTIGPEATKVDVKLKSAVVSVFGGRAELNGLVLGNPAGCTTPSSIAVDDVRVRVKPGSVFGPKLIVEGVDVKNPIITFEGGLTDNNLATIEKNLTDYVGGPASAPAANSTAAPGSPAKSERKLQVDDLVIRGAKVQASTLLSGGRTLTLSIPDIHLTGLGAGPDGITPVEVAQRALRAILEASTSAIAKNASQLGKDVLTGARSLDVKKATAGLKSLLK